MAFTFTATTMGSYGFSQSGNTFTSTNAGVNSSASVTKITYNCNGGTYHLYLDCYNGGESNYDFGLISNIGSTLSTSNTTDTTGVKKSFKGLSSASLQTVDMGTVTGSNFFYIKFRKDGSVNTSPDRLQVTIRAVSLGYKLTYQTNGGTLPEGTVNPASGVSTLPSLPTCTKPGYYFDGWYKDSEFTTKAYGGTTLTGDTILYAKFRKIKATFDLTTLKTMLEPGVYSITFRSQNHDFFESPNSTATSWTIRRINATLSHMTADASNPTMIDTSTTTPITLRFYADTGYTVPTYYYFKRTGFSLTYTKVSDSECTVAISSITSSTTEINLNMVGILPNQTLLNTKWQLSSTIATESGFTKEFKADGAYSTLSRNFYVLKVVDDGFGIWDANSGNYAVYWESSKNMWGYYTPSGEGYTSTAPILTFTGGADIDNPDLNYWIRTHATRVY